MKTIALIFFSLFVASGDLLPPGIAKYRIVIIKSEFTLYLYKGDSLQKSYPVAIGKNEGDKERVGDWKTPEGNFIISEIKASAAWVHNFKDGRGNVKGAYGPWFFRLNTEGTRTLSGKTWKGIAIHGTDDEGSIGIRVSEGCIRLRNKDIEELRDIVEVGMAVEVKR